MNGSTWYWLCRAWDTGTSGTLCWCPLGALPCARGVPMSTTFTSSDEALLSAPEFKTITDSLDKTAQALAWIFFWGGPLKKFSIQTQAPFIDAHTHQLLGDNARLSGSGRTVSRAARVRWLRLENQCGTAGGLLGALGSAAPASCGDVPLHRTERASPAPQIQMAAQPPAQSLH